MVRIPTTPTAPDPLRELRHLTPRDRLVLSWLAEHYVLSTEQIAAAAFPSVRAAQIRLAVLYRIGAVSRFSFARTEATTGSYRYTLGPLGALLHPDAYTDPDHPGAKPPKTHLERRARITRSPRLPHLLGVNQFFIDLIRHTRTHPDAALLRWWSEQHATAAFETALSRIRPDAHGVWQAAGHQVGLFLEYDRDTEDVARVIGKLRQYEKLAADGGPRYPVLFWVPDRRREASLLRALTSVRLPIPVATAIHSPHPAGPVWALPGDPGPRLCLHDLPSEPAPERRR